MVPRVKNSPELMSLSSLNDVKRRSDSGSEKQAVDDSEQQHARRFGKIIKQRHS